MKRVLIFGSSHAIAISQLISSENKENKFILNSLSIGEGALNNLTIDNGRLITKADFKRDREKKLWDEFLNKNSNELIQYDLFILVGALNPLSPFLYFSKDLDEVPLISESIINDILVANCITEYSDKCLSRDSNNIYNIFSKFINAISNCKIILVPSPLVHEKIMDLVSLPSFVQLSSYNIHKIKFLTNPSEETIIKCNKFTERVRYVFDNIQPLENVRVFIPPTKLLDKSGLFTSSEYTLFHNAFNIKTHNMDYIHVDTNYYLKGGFLDFINRALTQNGLKSNRICPGTAEETHRV